MTAILCGLRRGFGVSLFALIALATAASPAASGTFASSAESCAGQVLEQPFRRWLDPAQYVLAPNGALEDTRTQWTLAGGAEIVAGNEWYWIHRVTDTRSLSLPSGSSATTRPMCVGLEHPTLRLLVVNTGSVLSTLEVEVLFEDVFGAVQSVRVATLAGGSTWQPTLPIAFLANVPGSLLSADGTASVAFRFTPRGSGSGWRIDDVYVDPFKGR